MRSTIIPFRRTALIMGFLAACAPSASLGAESVPPQLGNAGREGWRDFQHQPLHRAFALAPGGAWSWKAEESSAAIASENALQACGEHTEQQCVLYAVDNQMVFDTKAWARLWGPYKTRAEAARAAEGKRRGERFHDLAIASPAGKPLKLSDLRGKVVLVHFWGTWCSPCRQEMPELQKLSRELGATPDIQLVLLQMREDIATARRWAEGQRIKLPLYDSGIKEAGADALTLAGGKPIRDRELSMVFPTTYVLDKHGVVVFSHTGPVSGWLDYLPFLRDVAARSGK